MKHSILLRIGGEHALRGTLSLEAKGDALLFVVFDLLVFDKTRLAPVELTVISVLGYVAASALTVISGLF